MNNGNICEVHIHDDAIGSYIVKYGEYTLEATINLESKIIDGPNKVSPYGFYTYTVEGNNVVFSIDNTAVAQIISQDGHKCKIEILTGRKDRFNLYCSFEKDNEEQIITLPITIGSFTGEKNEKDLGLVS
jgi:hypothetical protein